MPEVSNIVKARFDGKRSTSTAALTQYDYGQNLVIEGIDLPSSFEAHFTNRIGEETKTAIGLYNVVQIPDEYLLSGRQITCYIYLHVGDDDGETVYTITIPVTPRAKPSDVEPTPVEQSVIDQIIAALNTGIDHVDALAEQIPLDISSALQEAKESGEFDGPQGPQGERGEQGPPGENGRDGRDGIDGRDGAQGPRGETGPRGEQGPRGFQGLQGIQGIQGPKGDTGDAFHIVKTYSSIAEMNADYGSSDVRIGEFVMIASTVEDPDNAKCYVKGDRAFVFVVDMSGSAGIQGPQGPQGEQGIQGPQGPQGIQGIQGPPGDDYVLTAQDKEDIAGLVDVSVQDVQIDGTSIVSDGVAEIPIASTAVGLVRVQNGGLHVDSTGLLRTAPASDSEVKAATASYVPIVPSRQHQSTFYGLAKAAGDTTQSASTNAVGTYTDDAKSAISQMLNSPVTVSGSTPTITALPGIRYVCGECATLDITLPASGIVDVVFESGSTATVLTITPPTGVTVKWANLFDPTALEANATYEINIADGLGVAVQWS